MNCNRLPFRVALVDALYMLYCTLLSRQQRFFAHPAWLSRLIAAGFDVCLGGAPVEPSQSTYWPPCRFGLGLLHYQRGALVEYSGQVPDWVTGVDRNPIAGIMGCFKLHCVLDTSAIASSFVYVPTKQVRLTPVKLAPSNSAQSRLAPVKFAPAKFAPWSASSISFLE